MFTEELMKAMAQARENERVGALGRREKYKNVAWEKKTSKQYLLYITY